MKTKRQTTKQQSGSLDADRISDLIDLLTEASESLRDELLWVQIEKIIRDDILSEDPENMGESKEEKNQIMINKSVRLLTIYEQLTQGKVVYKKDMAQQFQVNEKTIQRDLDDIRAYLSEVHEFSREVVYDRRVRGYVLR